MPRLSAISIENMRPRAQRYAVPDSGCRGLYLNVYPTGRKSWSVRYRFAGTTRNLTLEGFPPLAQARKAATTALAAVEQGKDPAAAKQEARRADRVHVADTIEHWAGLFVERHAKLNSEILPRGHEHLTFATPSRRTAKFTGGAGRSKQKSQKPEWPAPSGAMPGSPR